MLEYLEGKKTYITAVLIFLVAGLHAVRKQLPVLDSIGDGTWETIMNFLKTGGVAMLFAFLRRGVSKAEK